MARYSNQDDMERPLIKFSTSIFRGKKDNVAPRMSMMDFISKQSTSVVEEKIEQRFAES